MECLVVIPARGGSKGVPRKNVAPLAGIPLVAHAIAAARAATRVTRVLVSTDDPEIAAVALRHGAEVLQRPGELSGDTASSESAVLHALSTLAERERYEPELVMLMQCTSPLTSAADLDGLVCTLERERADSAFIAVPYHHFLWRRGEGGVAEPINHDGKKRKRRQDMAPQYLENGAAYVMRTRAFVASGERFCGRSVLHVVDASRAFEIDEPNDLLQADVLIRARRVAEARELLPNPLAALVLDFDGVLTDDGVYVDESGAESVRCQRGDGLGLALLRERPIRLLILSKERNPVVSARADKLRIECLQGVDDKLTVLRAWVAHHGIDPRAIVYAGNDVNDLACMGYVGCAVAPSDAHDEAKRAAHIVLRGAGGRGAVRELCDLILARA